MNKLEQLRCDRMMRSGCVACAWLGLPHVSHECHHILIGGRRAGDWFTLPLCRGHHQGDWSEDQKQIIPEEYRVAISDGRNAMRNIYPTEQKLWDLVQEGLGLSWPVSKIVPRRVANGT